MVNENNILMHSTYNVGKSVVTEMFIRILKCRPLKKWQLIILIVVLVISIN